MMGQSGGPSGSVASSEAVNLASGAAALSALASLLEVVSNPAAAKSALKDLNSKSAEIQALLDQVKNQYQAIDTMHKEVSVKQNVISSGLKEIDTRESDLKKRETDVQAKISSVSSREDSLLKAKQDFDQLQKKKEAEHAARAAALTKAENETAIHLSTVTAATEKQLAERKAAFDAEMTLVRKEFDSKVASATEKDKASAAALAIAEAKKQQYENRMASLKQLMQESQ